MFQTSPIFDQLPDYPAAHCATLVELPSGHLLAAWFGGAFEKSPDVVILGATYDPATRRWSSPRVLAEILDRALGQPVFIVRPDGELWLFFNAIMGHDWTSAQPFLQRSSDNGATWDTPQQLFDYPGFMFRSRAHVTATRIMLPAYDEVTWQSRMMFSDDDGQSWQLTDPLTTPQGNIHPCVVSLAPGRLLAYLRTGGKGGVIWRTESADDGASWQTPTPTRWPNPNAGIDLLRLQNGHLLLAFNNSATRRTPLCLALATADEEFSHIRAVEDQEGEFSYPTLLQTQDGHIHLVYTHKRRFIQHAIFDEKWLTAQA